MERQTRPTIQQVEAALALLDKRAVILAYQAYQLEMHGVPSEIFGGTFDDYLDQALRNGDRLRVLAHGTHDVLSTISEVARDETGEWPVLRDSLAAALPEDVFLTIMGLFERD